MISVGEVEEKRELLAAVGGNINWYSFYGIQYGTSLNVKLKFYTH